MLCRREKERERVCVGVGVVGMGCVRGVGVRLAAQAPDDAL